MPNKKKNELSYDQQLLRRALLLLQRPETVVGIVALVVAGVLLQQSLTNRSVGNISSGVSDSVTDLAISESAPSPTPQRIATSSAALKAEIVVPDSKKPPAPVLPTVRVKSGDSYWTIARRHCGSVRSAASLETYNQTAANGLQIGQHITLVCALK